MSSQLFDRNLILVVDDDREFLESVVIMLDKEIPGVKLFKALDGITASAIYENSNPAPAVIILDMMLPKRSGFLVLEKIKRTSPAKPLPHVIMVTANPGARHKAYAEMLGVFEYLRKPFPMFFLLQAVQKARAAIN